MKPRFQFMAFLQTFEYRLFITEIDPEYSLQSRLEYGEINVADAVEEYCDAIEMNNLGRCYCRYGYD